MKNIKNGLLVIIFLMSGVLLQGMEPVEQLRGKLTGLTGKLRTVQERTHTLQAMLVRLENRLRALAGLPLKLEPAGLPPMPPAPPAPPAPPVAVVPTPPAAAAAPMPPAAEEAASELPTDAFRAQVRDVLQLTPDEEHFLFEPLSALELSTFSTSEEESWKGVFENLKKQLTQKLNDAKQERDKFAEKQTELGTKEKEIEVNQTQQKEILGKYALYAEMGKSATAGEIQQQEPVGTRWNLPDLYQCLTYYTFTQKWTTEAENLKIKCEFFFDNHLVPIIGQAQPMIAALKDQMQAFCSNPRSNNSIRKIVDFMEMLQDKNLVTHEEIVKKILVETPFRSQGFIAMYILLKLGYRVEQFLKFVTGAILWIGGQAQGSFAGVQCGGKQYRPYELGALWNLYLLLNTIQNNYFTEKQLTAIKNACEFYTATNKNNSTNRDPGDKKKTNDYLTEQLNKKNIEESTFQYVQAEYVQDIDQNIKTDILNMIKRAEKYKNILAEKEACDLVIKEKKIFKDLDCDQILLKLEEVYQQKLKDIQEEKAQLQQLAQEDQAACAQEQERLRREADEEEDRKNAEKKEKDLQEIRDKRARARLVMERSQAVIYSTETMTAVMTAGLQVKEKNADQSESDYQGDLEKDAGNGQIIEKFEKIAELMKRINLQDALEDACVNLKVEVCTHYLDKLYQIDKILIAAGKIVKLLISKKSTWETILLNGDSGGKSQFENIVDFVKKYYFKWAERYDQLNELLEKIVENPLMAINENKGDLEQKIEELDKNKINFSTFVEPCKLQHKGEQINLLKIYFVVDLQEQDLSLVEEAQRTVNLINQDQLKSMFPAPKTLMRWIKENVAKNHWDEFARQVIAKKKAAAIAAPAATAP